MALIHRWPLTSGPEDVVGGLHMTNNGGVTFDASGAVFSGSNRLLCNKTWPPVFCLSAWVKYPSAGPLCLLGIADSSGCRCAGFMGDTNAFLSIHGGTLKLYTGQDLSGGQWHHLLFRGYASGTNTWEFWVDSASCSTGVSGFTLASTFALGGIGAYSADGAAGNILDARIYDHTLSQAEINALVAAGPNIIPTWTDLPLSRPPLPALLGGSPYVGQKGWRV